MGFYCLLYEIASTEKYCLIFTFPNFSSLKSLRQGIDISSIVQIALTLYLMTSYKMWFMLANQLECKLTLNKKFSVRYSISDALSECASQFYISGHLSRYQPAQ